MSEGILGRKVGMTSVFMHGQAIPVTVIEAGPCTVTQVKKIEGPDGYDALQLGFMPKKDKQTNKPAAGHFAKAGVKPMRYLREFRGMGGREVGDVVKVEDLFEVGNEINVTGTSKGRGYAGVMKRHGFHGHKASHGTHESKRGPGSIGAASYPSRVWRGKRMAGQYGNKRITVRLLEVVEIIPERNLLLVRGAVPGARNSLVVLRKEVA